MRRRRARRSNGRRRNARPARVRFNTSSLSFRKIGRLIICSWGSREPRPKTTATIPAATRSRSIRVDLATGWDIDHSAQAFFTACDGTGTLPGTKCKMDGWNKEQAGFGHPQNFAYAYVTQSEITPYWDMAKQYVLADHMFASNLDGSFISHQYAVAALSRAAPSIIPARTGDAKADSTTRSRRSRSSARTARRSSSASITPRSPAKPTLQASAGVSTPVRPAATAVSGRRIRPTTPSTTDPTGIPT